jgi:putative transposase
MLHVTLTSAERQAVERERHAAKTTTVVRVRCQMVLWSADGWSPPRIARHLSYHPHTVRAALHRFQACGLAGLAPDPPGPAPNTSRREQVVTALGQLLDQERTWTAAQLTAALREQGIVLSVRQVRKYLARLRARWRRTVRTLEHKQDPVRAASAQHTLGALKKGLQQGASPWRSSTNAASPPASR